MDQLDEVKERVRDEGGGEEEEEEGGEGLGKEEEEEEEEEDRRGRGRRPPHDDVLAEEDRDMAQAEELFGVSGEELGDVVSKYAKIHQPVPFSSQTPRWRLSLEWHDINYKVVVPLPPKSILLRLLFKLPIPSMVTNVFRPKKEIPILNHVSGKIYAGQVVAIMGPTGSGKVHLTNTSCAPSCPC
jgi:ABC-type multidrug transport system fused ATPase/permease subunit